MNDLQRMKTLVQTINEADKAYYQDDKPIMTDREYDALVIQLTMLEQSTGIRFSDSPIGKIPSDAKEGLKTVKHTKPMLSCNKTKNIDDIIKFANDKEIVLSWKLDGLTLVLRYERGKMVKAITRGNNGTVGEDVTHTVKHFRNIPFTVPCKENFEVRGEGVISWEDFEIFCKLSKNTTHPRNIASGAVRSLDPDIGKLNHLDFFAFELIKDNAPETKIKQLEFLSENNFDVVEHRLANTEKSDLKEEIEKMLPENFGYPVDGIVAEYNDIAYGKKLGATAHHEKRMIALKWKDEIKETKFRGVELITTRTGVVSIVAKFDEVIIDGARVHRANMHNLANFERYRFGEGDIIKVYKANMIIPQIAENMMMSGSYKLPEYCPSCGESLTVKVTSGGVKQLYCPNEDCIARNSRKIARFCEKDAMNIEGLSVNTLETLMAHGWIKNFKDLYHLNIHRDDIIHCSGFDIDRYNMIWNAIENSRNCFMYQLLVGLGIPLLGREAAGVLHQYYYGSVEDFEKAILDNYAFSHIDGISSTVERKIYEWYKEPVNQNTLHALMAELKFKGVGKSVYDKSNPFCDMNIVVTGTFENYNRNDILELLTALGARTSSYVEKDTDFLIYGSLPSSKKVGFAMEYGVNMINETKFSEMLSKHQF